MSGLEKARVLVTGASGQLGKALCRIGSARGLNVVALSHAELDIGDRQDVLETLQRHAPTHIINAAAYTAVDAAESDISRAYLANRDGAAHLAEAAGDIGCRLLHVSTDFVFDGNQGKPYSPYDTPNPLNVYGASKLAGERAIIERLGDSALIVRTAWVYSPHGRNFLTTMLRLMRERRELRVVEDQVGTPTHASGLAAALWHALDRDLTGIHHWTDAGVASWYDFAVAIDEIALERGLIAEKPSIIPVSTAEFPTAARRPSNSILDKSSMRVAIDNSGMHWRSALASELDLIDSNE